MHTHAHARVHARTHANMCARTHTHNPPYCLWWDHAETWAWSWWRVGDWLCSPQSWAPLSAPLGWLASGSLHASRSFAEEVRQYFRIIVSYVPWYVCIRDRERYTERQRQRQKDKQKWKLFECEYPYTCADIHAHIEGFRPEWYIFTMIYCPDTSFRSETLDLQVSTRLCLGPIKM